MSERCSQMPKRERLRVAILSQEPTPYRLPVFERIAAEPDIDLCVFFSCRREPARAWELPAPCFGHVFLRDNFIRSRGRTIHCNWDIWPKLRAFEPDIVVTNGFNPTHLLAYAYSRLHGGRHVAMSDGTPFSEATLGWLHRWMRRWVYARSVAFVGASQGTLALFRSYGAEPQRIFQSHLCANNSAFEAAATVEKRFDFLFSGRFAPVKNPLFALNVASRVARKLRRRISIAFAGSGAMESEIRATALTMAQEVDFVFLGFVQQDGLPQVYGAARIFLFPTLWDPWGVVANEACAAGLPVLISPAAGAATELIRDGENGFVLPLDLDAWVDSAVRLLSDADLYSSMSASSRALVGEYTYENAAAGLIAATRAAMRAGNPPSR